jgi:hypothetical protein
LKAPKTFSPDRRRSAAFTNRQYRVEGNFIPNSLESKISKQIVHLSHGRTDVENDKLSNAEREQTAKFLEQQVKNFENALKPKWRAVWQKGFLEMNLEGEPYKHTEGRTGVGPPRTASSYPAAGPTSQIQSLSSQPVANSQSSELGTTSFDDSDGATNVLEHNSPFAAKRRVPHATTRRR